MTHFLTTILRASQKHVQKSPAIEYLHTRGVSEDQIKGLNLGYFPEDVWPPYLTVDSDDFRAYLKWSGKGVRLRGKLVFPMQNASGMLRGIQIRSPDPEVKDYSKFYLERSKVDAIFFGVDLAMPHIWTRREVVLCEGIFDLPPLQRVYPNTLCTGTANVSKRQIEFLERYVDDVVIAFDSDWRGDQFFREFSEEYSSQFKSIRRLRLGAKDISDMWQRAGSDEAFQKLLDRRSF